MLPFPHSTQLWLTESLLLCKFCVKLSLFPPLTCEGGWEINRCCFVLFLLVFLFVFCLYVKASYFGMLARHLPGFHFLHRMLPILHVFALFKHNPSLCNSVTNLSQILSLWKYTAGVTFSLLITRLTNASHHSNTISHVDIIYV